MRLLKAFSRLIRLPNLFFVVLTQVLFQFCVYYPLYTGVIPAYDTRQFIFLVMSSVFIAAAGYIINDYFDINIDEVNKPERMVVNKTIRRRWAMAWHLILNFAGIAFTIAALPNLHKVYIVFANMLCIALLWFYSTTFKGKLLIGNIIISLLTAWTILLIFFSKISISHAFNLEHINQPKFFRFAFLYAGFAFIISLIREAVKDIEDMDGDARYGCRTIPIVWGISMAKKYIAAWLLILIGILVVIQIYVLQFRWWWAVVYCVLAIIIPLVFILLRLFKASSVKDYHQLGNYTKLVMLTGILSMTFFYFYL